MAVFGMEKSYDIPISSFAVYLCNTDRASVAAASSVAGAAAQEDIVQANAEEAFGYERTSVAAASSVAGAAAQEDITQANTEEEAFGIKLIVSSLTSEQECLLQLFLIRRLKKGAIYSGLGNFSGMDFSLTEKPSSPAVCYYILLPCDSKSEQAEQVLICLLADADTNLEVFRPELTQYCEALAQRIPHSTVAEFPKPLYAEISTWLTDCIYYVCRVLNSMGEGVAVLLQLAQQNRKVVCSDNVSLKGVTDTRRFISTCAVVEYLGSAGKVECAEDSAVVLKTGTAEGKLRIDDVNFNSYCREWAHHLLALGEDCEPWKIRKVLEAFKLKTIKDMNTLKRFLKQSETDHYSLYRAYTFLVSSGNSDILLKQVKMEGSSADDVIEVLEQHLSEIGPIHNQIRVLS